MKKGIKFFIMLCLLMGVEIVVNASCLTGPPESILNNCVPAPDGSGDICKKLSEGPFCIFPEMDVE